MTIYNQIFLFGRLIAFFCFFILFGCKEDILNEQERKSEAEKLINDALGQVVFTKNNDFRYINLIDVSITTLPIQPKDIRYKEVQGLLLKYNFSNDVFSDSTIINWKDYKLNKVKVITRETIPYKMYNSRKDTLIYHDVPQKNIDSLNRITYEYFYTKVEKSWDRKQINEHITKARNKYEADFPFEDNFLHYMSKPLFSRDRKFAIITINREVTGASYIFKKVKDRWELEIEFRSWIR